MPEPILVERLYSPDLGRQVRALLILLKPGTGQNEAAESKSAAGEVRDAPARPSG
jgi:hypothetical protein